MVVEWAAGKITEAEISANSDLKYVKLLDLEELLKTI